MSKHKKFPKQHVEKEEISIDPRIEKAIFCKKNSIVTFLLDDQSFKFDVAYDAIKDDYQIGYSLVHKARFFGLLHAFEKEVEHGVLVIRTFLDETSHTIFNAEGMSVAIPFKEIRMFEQLDNKVLTVDVASAFNAMITNNETGEIDWNLVDKSEIFCDDTLRFTAEELKSVFLELLEKK